MYLLIPSTLSSLIQTSTFLSHPGGQKKKKMEQATNSIVFLAFVLLFFASSGVADPLAYNVLNYGAKPDDNFDSTPALVAAWTLACGSINPATIYVPPGRFLVRNVVFRGQCNNNGIVFRIDGTLVAPSDYKVIGSTGNWLLFEHVNGVSVYGGVLDGQGTGLWTCKRSGKGCPSGATVSLTTIPRTRTCIVYTYTYILQFDSISASFEI